MIRPTQSDDIPAVVALQRLCFPDPFPEDLLWTVDHLRRHLDLFPSAQCIAEANNTIVASASNTRISEDRFQAHTSWEDTVGGPYLKTFDPEGSTLYGLDISVHPEYRRLGLGRLLYEARFNWVRSNNLTRYATACRLPGLQAFSGSLESYLHKVADQQMTDRTLTPLLRYGLTLVGGIEEYMDDEESRNCAALLEWKPSEAER